MSQESILHEILEIYTDIEELQQQINTLVNKNRQMIKEKPDFEEDYTECIESYFIN